MTTNLEKLAIVASIACILKFLVEGVNFSINGSPVSLGHVDASAYAMLLAPLWGPHAYISTQKKDV
jgi:hypothetical protein